MHEVFQNWPKVETAYKLIRATRSERYFADWDRFSRKWAEVLGVPGHIAMMSGPNLGAVIDTLFEMAPTGEHEVLKASILEATDFDKARSILERPPAPLVDAAKSPSALQAATKDRNTLLEAVRNHIACVTVEGGERLRQDETSRPIPLAERWRGAWEKAIRLHADHQIAHEEATSGANQKPNGPTASFASGVEEYLERYAHTDTFSTMLVAAFPFVSLPPGLSPASDELLDVFSFLSERTAGTMRLIGDVVFNPEERINTILFVHSRMQGLSLAEAKVELEKSQPVLRGLLERLVAHAEKRLEGVESLLDSVWKKYPTLAQLKASFDLLMGASRYQIKLGRDALSS
jgi:hypothetical protein